MNVFLTLVIFSFGAIFLGKVLMPLLMGALGIPGALIAGFPPGKSTVRWVLGSLVSFLPMAFIYWVWVVYAVSAVESVIYLGCPAWVGWVFGVFWSGAPLTAIAKGSEGSDSASTPMVAFGCICWLSVPLLLAVIFLEEMRHPLGPRTPRIEVTNSRGEVLTP